jgi:hypothetical protein
MLSTGMSSSSTGSNSSAPPKRTTSALQSDVLGSAAKLASSSRDKERKENENVELMPPWDLLPFAPDPSAGSASATPLTIGYPDFYPSKGAEEEYKLTEKAITDGFDNKPIVAVSLHHSH